MFDILSVAVFDPPLLNLTLYTKFPTPYSITTIDINPPAFDVPISVSPPQV